MPQVQLKINGKEVTVPDFFSVRKTALKNGIYIPGLCSHPELNPFKPFAWSEAIWQGDKRIEHDGSDPPLPPPAIAGGENSQAPPHAITGEENSQTPPHAIAGEENSQAPPHAITGEENSQAPPPLCGGGIKGGGAENDFPHCNLCLVSIDGGAPQRACTTRVADGMKVRTTGDDLVSARRESLRKILAHHPHACLTCAQKEGCSRTDCSMNVPTEERCCELLGRCEIGKVAEYVGIPSDTPAYKPSGIPVIADEPLFIREYEICIGCLRCVRICRDVREVDVLGAVEVEGRTFVGTVEGSTLSESYCRYCGACVEVCPTGALRDKPGLEPLVDGQAPCVAACPLDIDIPGYMDLVSRGLELEALELIRQRAVLPGALGYACFHPCEDVCRRGELNDALSICAVKRYASDSAHVDTLKIEKLLATGKRVAVIGGGPAGLAAAAELLRWGHSVTLFEKNEKLGGMLRQTIPCYRLPDEIIDRDLKYLYDLGLEVRTRISLGDDFEPDGLLEEGFDAVVIAIGLPNAVQLDIEGIQPEGVISGLDFLRRAARREAEHIVDPVVVIGGGSVAVDAAMTARRLGARLVTLVCLESSDEMPASTDELFAALEEGIPVMHKWGVAGFEDDGGRIRRVLLKRCTRVFDKQGHFKPEYDERVTERIPAAMVIVAIGQSVSEKVKSYIAEKPGIFIAGDVSTGPSSIVKAMADGKQVAEKVDKYIGCEGHKQPIESLYKPDTKLGRIDGFADKERAEPQRINPRERIKTFDLYEATFESQAAREEALRCLQCQLRASMMKSPLPPDPWHTFNQDILEFIPTAEGVVILADETRATLKIVGTADINLTLRELIDDGYEAAVCRWELDPMYTKRESELLQAHLQAYGELPGADDLDDLF